jgi:hypothetical protein
MSEKWYEQGNDWCEIDEPWTEIDNFGKAILDKVHILDILDKYEIDYARTSSGNFTHKLRCPFPNHLSGQERTASLCISERNNDFHCYGCNANGNVITFVMLFLGVPYNRALELLAKLGGVTNGDDLDEELLRPKEKIDPNHTIMPYIFKSGVLIREFLKDMRKSENYTKWCLWAAKQYKRLDHYLDTLNDEQWEVAKKYHDKIYKYLELKKESK